MAILLFFVGSGAGRWEQVGDGEQGQAEPHSEARTQVPSGLRTPAALRGGWVVAARSSACAVSRLMASRTYRQVVPVPMSGVAVSEVGQGKKGLPPRRRGVAIGSVGGIVRRG
jgi:hypothetical protein